ncbi:MAG: IS21 family transposase, partial [Clostridiales bacterium]|nr:IS21 family transposase [Clostridiales bacterium]
MGFLRRRLLVPVPTITDFTEFNKTLFLRAEELNDRPHYRYGFNILGQMKEDSLTFQPLPSPFDCNAYLS